LPLAIVKLERAKVLRPRILKPNSNVLKLTLLPDDQKVA